MLLLILSASLFIGGSFQETVPLCSADTEEYEECGTACPASCEDPSPSSCNDMCVQGCFCQDGLVRQVKDGPCVPLDTCLVPLQCGANEALSDCGTLCPATCDGSEQGIECLDVCLKLCECQEGYIRQTLGGQCISNASCTAQKLKKLLKTV